MKDFIIHHHHLSTEELVKKRIWEGESISPHTHTLTLAGTLV